MVITERKKTGQEVARRRQQTGKQQEKEQSASVQMCPVRGCWTGSRVWYLQQFRVISSGFTMIEKCSCDK